MTLGFSRPAFLSFLCLPPSPCSSCNFSEGCKATADKCALCLVPCAFLLVLVTTLNDGQNHLKSFICSNDVCSMCRNYNALTR